MVRRHYYTVDVHLPWKCEFSTFNIWTMARCSIHDPGWYLSSSRISSKGNWWGKDGLFLFPICDVLHWSIVIVDLSLPQFPLWPIRKRLSCPEEIHACRSSIATSWPSSEIRRHVRLREIVHLIRPMGQLKLSKWRKQKDSHSCGLFVIHAAKPKCGHEAWNVS